jgi:hypothetical protein
LVEAVDFLAGCLKMTEKKSGFFARGSHARENDKLRECVPFSVIPARVWRASDRIGSQG